MVRPAFNPGTLGCRGKEVSVEIKDSKGYTEETCSS